MRTIAINHKKIRAEVIKEYLGDRPAFILSCGNGARWLKRAGVACTTVEGEELDTLGYISPRELEERYGGFNTTSGYLPLFLMEEIAKRIAQEIDAPMNQNATLYVPRASGELAFALSFLHPSAQIVPITSKQFAPIMPEVFTPLNEWIAFNTKGDLALDACANNKEIEIYLEKNIAREEDTYFDTSPAQK